MNIITPIKPQNFREFLDQVKLIKNRADWIEIWLDNLENYDDFFENFAKSHEILDLKFLAVCKKKMKMVFLVDQN